MDGKLQMKSRRVLLIREIIAFIFRFSGAPFLIREVFQRKKVTILVYHNPSPETFRNHIGYLAKHYNFITLNNLADSIISKNWSRIPPKGLVITLDDGHIDNYKLIEIFKEYVITPTIYLCSHIVNTGRRFWFEATEKSNHPELKKCSNRQRLQVLNDEVGYEPTKEHPVRQALDIEEIKDMCAYIDFECHSKFHPILVNCSDDESENEIMESRQHLEKLLNKKVEHFSYPNGDYGNRELNYVKNSGYKTARTLDIGWNGIETNPYMLKAMVAEDDASINILCAQMNGFFGYLRYFSHGSFNGKHPSCE